MIRLRSFVENIEAAWYELALGNAVLGLGMSQTGSEIVTLPVHVRHRYVFVKVTLFDFFFVVVVDFFQYVF